MSRVTRCADCQGVLVNSVDRYCRGCAQRDVWNPTANIEADTVKRIVAWLRAEAAAWLGSVEGMRAVGEAFTWAADAIERGDWRKP